MTEEQRLAKRILDVIPMSMAQIRGEMRGAKPSDLSVPQFRILASIFHGRNRVGEMAKHLGVSQPAMSKMVEALVGKGLVQRDTHAKDRRQVPLKFTDTGKKIFMKVRKELQLKLSKRIEGMTSEDCVALERGLEQIEIVFGLRRTT